MNEEHDCEEKDDDSQVAWSADSLSYENSVSMRDSNHLVAGTFTQGKRKTRCFVYN